MRSGASLLLLGAALVALVPALAQRTPESILPPGFEEPAAPSQPAPEAPPSPARPDAAPDDPAPPAGPAPVTTIDEPNADALAAADAGNALAEVAPLQDLPPAARRSLDQVGLLAPEDGGFGPATFGAADGRFLASLMREMKAPIASRWASILLRRALLSQATIPAGIDGADWVGERAWLLVRMGEADNARLLVQRVDSDRYTPWLYDVAMQAALASADPAGLCGIADAGAAASDKPSWTLARAMCAGLEAEGGTASALAGRVRDTRRAGGVDVLLAEKVAGAGTNTRRVVAIQWDNVEQLTAWRYGLAAATAVPVPPRLYATVGPQVQAWAARAPLYEPAARLPFGDRAATLGVFSQAALVDLYASAYDRLDASERREGLPAQLRAAYLDDAAARLEAIRGLWGGDDGSLRAYARLILTARAVATLPGDVLAEGEDRDRAIAAMLTTGLDIQAARLATGTASGSLGWALLAVGAPRAPFAIDGGTVEGYAGLRGRFLFAGLAGLGRLPAGDIAGIAERMSVAVGRETSWTRALDGAVARGERGTVALLAAVGLQATSWAQVPPDHLYRIVRSLSAVGLEPEARMIAAEAVTRS